MIFCRPGVRLMACNINSRTLRISGTTYSSMPAPYVAPSRRHIAIKIQTCQTKSREQCPRRESSRNSDSEDLGRFSGKSSRGSVPHRPHPCQYHPEVKLCLTRKRAVFLVFKKDLGPTRHGDEVWLIGDDHSVAREQP